MLGNRLEAQIKLEDVFLGVKVKSWTRFNELYLFRVEYPPALGGETNFDPFFSVDPITEEVRDFSVLTDITSDEFLSLEWNDI